MTANILRLKQLYFSAAHFLRTPDGKLHPKCGVIHGHTYIVEDLLVEVGAFVDLGDIKAAVKEFDHRFLVPDSDPLMMNIMHILDVGLHNLDKAIWPRHFPRMKLTLPDLEKFLNFKVLPKLLHNFPATSVENIHEVLRRQLLNIPGVLNAEFSLYEGIHNGTVGNTPMRDPPAVEVIHTPEPE